MNDTALTFYDDNGRELTVAGAQENTILRCNGTFQIAEHHATNIAYELLLRAGRLEPEVVTAVCSLRDYADRREAQTQ